LAQAFNLSWPVVSLPNGAASARRALQRSVEFLSSYEQIVLCFDMDEVGQEAAAACVDILPPGKVAIAQLPLKDPSEMLVAGRVKEMTTAIWEAQTYRPDGIVTVSDVRAKLAQPIQQGLPWWSEALTGLTYGRRFGEAYALGAGTGVGKSDFLAQQIAYDVTELQQRVGLFMLEQQPVETLRRTAGKIAGKRFWIPDGSWTPEELNAAIDRLDGKVFLYDHFGAASWDVIEQRIRFLHGTEDVRIFYLDHLTALAANEDDERRALEQMMASLGGLVKALDVMVTFVSHLATPDGKPHEEGGRVMIRHFKGSRAIGFWSHFMFGLERDQQDQETPFTTFRILKDRYTGTSTGKTFQLGYDSTTGLLSEDTSSMFDEVSSPF
jgi:twinkle protein